MRLRLGTPQNECNTERRRIWKRSLLYPQTQRIEALVLSVGRYTMRVLARGSDDTMELTSSYGQWIDEAGVPIEFDAFVAR